VASETFSLPLLLQIHSRSPSYTSRAIGPSIDSSTSLWLPSFSPIFVSSQREKRDVSSEPRWYKHVSHHPPPLPDHSVDRRFFFDDLFRKHVFMQKFFHYLFFFLTMWSIETYLSFIHNPLKSILNSEDVSYVGYLGADGMIILKWILSKWDVD
jgi:hypothetical protein